MLSSVKNESGGLWNGGGILHWTFEGVPQLYLVKCRGWDEENKYPKWKKHVKKLGKLKKEKQKKPRWNSSGFLKYWLKSLIEWVRRLFRRCMERGRDPEAQRMCIMYQSKRECGRILTSKLIKKTRLEREYAEMEGCVCVS